MNDNNNLSSAYLRIVDLCFEHGIIDTPSMTEAELRAVLDSLCTSLRKDRDPQDER